MTIKDYIYVGFIIAVLGSTWFVAHNLYDKHILLPQRTIVSLEVQLKEVASHLNTCEANLTKQSLGGFIEGVSENETVITINLDNPSS